MMKSGWPNSTGLPLSTSTLTTRPATSDSIWFIIFMASMMHSVSPSWTRSPTWTKGAAPGEAAA